MIVVSNHSSINELNPQEWNCLVHKNHPLIRHEFLVAMENQGCIGEATGWLPRYVSVKENNTLIGVLLLYEKYNSMGEFVFDHAWAQAYKRLNYNYYPKLVAAIPFTPIAGQRLLVVAERRLEIYPLLFQGAIAYAKEIGASGFHCLFPRQNELEFFEANHLLTRFDCQYHWHNHGYTNFDDFLSKLTSRKRKQIKSERRKVHNDGITFRVLNGLTAAPADWQAFTHFYYHTYADKWGIPAFNQLFFEEVARQLGSQVILILAEINRQSIAGALLYKSDDTLYGRHWGCSRKVDFLHFETCYYQGIDYCIANNLQHFEPGAQGEHKVARGFIPTITRSSHWIAEPPFQKAIAEFIGREREAVLQYVSSLQSSSPYKKRDV